jgi:Uncharacterized protein conserved in bacteria N-term (DUF3322)
MRPLMHQIIDLDDADFEIPLWTARWFTGNPPSGLTIRQVPVLGMGTKWLARNRYRVWLLSGRRGQVALVVTSPPYGPSVHGHVRAVPGRGA